VTTKEELAGSKGGRPRSIQSQRAILDATLTLLAEEGFEEMSIEAIATRAGVGKKTIYRWWTSKEALVIDAIKSMQQTRNPVIDTGSLREDLLTMGRNALQYWSGPDVRKFVLKLLAVMITHPEVYQAFYDQAVAPRFQQLRHVIQRAQARGEVRQDLDADDVIGLIAGPIWYHIFLDASGATLTSNLPERLVDAILHGIAGQRKPEEERVDVTSRIQQGISTNSEE
jgi:AcrR family transcriptional regulator